MRKPPLLLVFAMAVLLLAGCGKDRGKNCALSGTCGTGAVVGTPDPTTPRGEEEVKLHDFDVGATTELTVINTDRLSEFVMRPLNSPKDVQINLNMEDWGGVFGGTVKIAYKDDDRFIIDEFSAGKDDYDAQHNVWFDNSNGDQVFHAFFEDAFGAVIVVIDELTDLGDGAQTGLLSGSVWFRNFLQTKAPNPSNSCIPGYGCPDTRCWFVEIGPYECRSFLVNDQIRTTSMVEPNNGYVKLGEFSSLSRKDGFNE